MSSHQVADNVAANCRDHDHDHQGRQRNGARGGQNTAQEDGRLPGQDETDEQRRLSKYQEADQRVRKRTRHAQQGRMETVHDHYVREGR